VVVQILQTWYHFEDIYFPRYGRKVRHVVDLITDDERYSYRDLNNKFFLGLKIFSRNNQNREIPFLEGNNNGEYTINLNFDPLTQYPDPDPDIIRNYPFLNGVSNLKHIKIEIEYILSNVEEDAQEDLNLFERILKKFTLKRYFTISIGGHIQPEFYITLPRGFRIQTGILSDGKKNFIEGGDVEMVCKAEKAQRDGTIKKKIISLKVDPPFVKNNLGFVTYNYLINDRYYTRANRISQYYDKIVYEFTYSTSPYDVILGLSLLPLIFLFFSSMILPGISECLLNNNLELKFGSQVGMSYLIVLLSFTYYYATLTNDDYNIPNRTVFIPAIGISIIVCFLIIAFGG
jgi:hypothetical protein